MHDLCIVIRRVPYGTLAAAEGVRHLIGATDAGMSVCAVLVDDGVYLAKQDQDPDDTGWRSLWGARGQTLGPRAVDSAAQARVYVHRESADTRGLDHLDLIPGVESIDDVQLAGVLTSADALLVF